MLLLPPNVSSYGSSIDRLFWIILGITGFFFFLVQGALLFFILKYRAGSHKKAAYIHGNAAVEIVWTVIPAIILLGLTIASQRVWADIRSPGRVPADAMPIQIQAEQFAWNIQYAGADGQFDTADDVKTINQLHIPVGKPVLIKLRSKDVIHSFFVPEFRVKQDAVPGLPTQVWLQATQPGQFEIRCAELCGLGHYRMKGFVSTESPERFAQWLTETKSNE